MSHAIAVCLIQSAGNLGSVLQHLRQWQRPFGQPRRQRLSLQIFHDDEINAVLPADVVQSAYVRMIQAGNNFGFALETLTARSMIGEMRWKNLDGDRAVESRIPRPVDLAHATHTERRDDLVGTQFDAVGQRHG